MAASAIHSRTLKLYLILNALALLSAAALMTLLAASGGFSNPRLLLVGATTALALAAAALAVRLHSQPARARRLAREIQAQVPRLRIALGVIFLISWCVTWIPPQATGDAYYYFIGLYPLILCGLLASGLGLIFIAAPDRRLLTAQSDKHAHPPRTTVTVMLVSLAAFVLIGILSQLGRILQNNEPYWRGAGVPLLSLQVLLVMVVGLLFLMLEARLLRKASSPDLVLFLLIWVVAAVLWSREPVPASYWVTGPRAPNFEYYPFSDLETFDLGSQFALIGQGIFNRQFWDRALYMSFLVYLHMIGGQNYQHLMSIQAGLFAIFPALMYLLGSRMHSRTAGLILGGLVILRGLNSLDASPWIHSSTFKHMLTDFPTAIGLAVFALLLLTWLESPGKHPGAAIWAGGVLGLTSLLRPHVLVILGATLPLCLWVERSRPRRGLLLSALTLAAFLAAIAPWTLLASKSASPFAFYGRRIQDVIRLRYTRVSPTATPSAVSGGPLVLPAATESSGPDLAAPPIDVPPIEPTLVPSEIAPTPAQASVPAPNLIPPPVTPAAPPARWVLPFPVLHYLHNLITSVLIFPSSPEFLSLDETLRKGEDFWQLRWNGQMSTVAAGMLTVNLLLIGFGLGKAFQRLRWVGLLPLAILLVYHLANSLARTSGGRYLVPVDWILVCYYAIALAELIRWGSLIFRPRTAPAAQPVPAIPLAGEHLSSMRPMWILAGLLLLGSLVPLAGVVHPLRYPPQNASDLLGAISPQVASLDLRAKDVEAFLAQPTAVLLQGRVLYPRFYRQGKGVEFSPRPLDTLNYPRTVFDLIGPHGLAYVVLPGRAPDTLPNASDAVVLGCRYTDGNAGWVSALAVVLPQPAVAIGRSPAAPLICPLPDPVCDDNGNCY